MREWKKEEGYTRSDTPVTAASASVSGSSDDDGSTAARSAATPSRRYSQLKKSLSNSKIFRSSPLRLSSRKLSIK